MKAGTALDTQHLIWVVGEPQADNAGHDSPIATSKSRSRLMASARPVETDTFHVHPNVQSHPSKASAEAVNTASPASSETHPDHEELSGGSHWNWKPGSMKDNPFFEQLLEYRPVSHLTEKVLVNLRLPTVSK
ncbi:hypothetical protein H4Q26_008515 [Puccinia striiformis f. sp. tritici PST-130]|nr:hypothetical protein H4Q26_008515 [Puccinia striiformis f. sp. tritici PST-130]